MDRIINNIFLDGQIDDCELTLKDISEVKKRFTYILTSIFHKRIEYPEIDLKGSSHKAAPRTELPAFESTVLRNPEVFSAQGNGNSDKEQPKAHKDKPA
ncbi:MAG TPA: hypothetical protein DHW81_03860 [Nitrospiraceae bacterium]|nr:hypothetical protein [Nitrospiraceae bacterium]